MAGAGYKLFNTGDVLTAAQVNTYLMQQTVMVFANASARTTALSGVLAEGMLSYLQDTNKVYVYDGSAWLDVSSEIPSQTGNSGKYLTTDGTTASWATVSSGGMTLIQETTASALSSLSFSSIPNSYKNLLLVWDGIYHSTSGSAFDIRFNNDSNSNYRIRGVLTENGGNTGTNTSDNAAAGYSAYNSAAYFGIENNVTSTQYVWQTFGSMLILNYASTTRFKTYVGNYGYRKAPYSVNVFSNEQTGLYSSTSAITSIDIVRLAGTATFSNATSTSIRLFGVN